jgi:hypothetical protein
MSKKEEVVHQREEAAAEKQKKAAFALDDPVVVDGKTGTVVEVVAHDEAWLAGHPQLYSVCLTPWERIEGKDVNGKLQVRYRNPANPDEVRDHEADTLGAIPEHALKRGT